MGGVQDRVAVALSRGGLYSSSQVLLIAPPERLAHVFTEDLERLIADLEMGGDRAAWFNDTARRVHIFRSLRTLQRLKVAEKVDREAARAAAQDRRFDQ